MKRLLLVVLALLAALAATASAARTPDAHDRALMAQLEAKVSAYDAIGKSADPDPVLDKCGFVHGDPSKAFAAAIAVLPALVIELVHRYHAALEDIEQTLAPMRPHDPVFRRWIAAEHDDVVFLLRFDNGGKKIDLCKAAETVLDHRVAAYRDVFGLPASVVDRFLAHGAAGESAELKRLDVQMRAFLVAGGVSPKHADELTEN